MNPASSSRLRPADPPQGQLDPLLAARHRLETLGQLSTGLAHELNDLLCAVLMHVEGVEALLPGPHPAKAELALVRQTAQRAGTLARRALQFGRPQTGAVTTVNLAALLDEALPLLRAATPRNVELRARCTLPSAMLVGEPTQLLHVLLNLVLNAVEALGTEFGTIDVQLTRQPAGPPPAVAMVQLGHRPLLCLTVSDTGPGLDQAARARLLDPHLAQADDTHPRVRMVREQVLQHEGGLTVESSPGEGTRFRIYFPEAPTRLAVPANRRAGPPDQPAPHIAIIDDEETVVQLAEQALHFAGYRTSVVNSPSDCLAQLGQNPAAFDLVITDQRMPDLSGTDLLRTLRAQGWTVPLVITSGSLADLSRQELDAAGPARFLPKPFTLLDLLTVIRELLDARAVSVPAAASA